MKAAILRNTGDTELDVVSDLETIDTPPGYVRVDIKAAGVCHSDLSAMNGTLPQPAPAVLGHEGAGVVAEVGEGVTHVAPGDHVIVCWTPPCGTCAFCTDFAQPHLCRTGLMTAVFDQNYRQGDEAISGFVGIGTWAEHVVMPQAAVVKIDDDIPFDIAALVGCGVTTGVGAAINRAKVKPGSSVVVFGCGGVGIAALQGAKICGAAEIVAVDLNKDKAEDAKRFGATHGVTPDELDAAKAEITGGLGFDYSFEAIGIPTTMRAAYDAIRPGGTAVIIGAGKMTDLVSFNGFELFMEEKTIMGSYFGSDDTRTSFKKMLRLWKAGRLDLEGMVSRHITLDGINDAIASMERGETIRQVIDIA